jgi:hypothetical protein
VPCCAVVCRHLCARSVYSLVTEALDFDASNARWAALLAAWAGSYMPLSQPGMLVMQPITVLTLRILSSIQSSIDSKLT